MTIIQILFIEKDNINAGESLFENDVIMQKHYGKYFMSISAFFILSSFNIPAFT